MLNLESQAVALRVSEDGLAVVLEDRRRGNCWRLDGALGGYRHTGERESMRPLGPGRAARRDHAIEVRHRIPEGEVCYTWRLEGDFAEVSLSCEAQDVAAVALPGAWMAESGPQRLAAPIYQGLLLGRRGQRWERRLRHSGHLGFSLSMGGLLGERGGLLVTHESHANWEVTVGEAEGGPFFRFEHLRCPVEGWVGGVVRMYPTDSSVTAVCRRYRARMKERGEFRSWQEKIQRKPIVRELFGSLMAFVGYNRTDEVDYAACARRLRAMGFESVFYYPVRMCQYSLGFRMGGDAPIWLPDEEIDAMRAVPGAHLAPWAWTVEGLDDGSEAMHRIFRRDAGGEPYPNWQIDQHQWYLVCTPYQVEHIRQRLATDLRAMDWIHYDVTANFAGRCCFSRQHELHGNRPLSRRDDLAWTQRLFSQETVGNRVVSSEGFGDHWAAWYDIGSTKVMPAEEALAHTLPVPMTMLTLHDSALHDWWEVHNYNAHAAFGLSPLPDGLGLTGCGLPRLKAAMDALYGCPPNVFPFGKQYGWSNFEKRQSFSYVVRLEDAAVQEALAEALPVARLHRRTGMCDLVSVDLLAGGAVQVTTFSDGARVAANLSPEPREAEGVGPLAGWEWRELRP
jgi:hypothetical protein